MIVVIVYRFSLDKKMPCYHFDNRAKPAEAGWSSWSGYSKSNM
jgi:hypothetical protein